MSWTFFLLKSLIHMAKCPKGLSCFKKQTAKHFLKLKKFKNLGIPGKLYKDYFHFNIYFLKISFFVCFSTFCETIQKVRTKSCFLNRSRVMKEYSSAPKYFVIPLPPLAIVFNFPFSFRHIFASFCSRIIWNTVLES